MRDLLYDILDSWRAIVFALVAIFVLLFLLWLQAVNESATYNRLTGANTTWWDALWVELRVQDQPQRDTP